jgi:hypothetical protein
MCHDDGNYQALKKFDSVTFKNLTTTNICQAVEDSKLLLPEATDLLRGKFC